MFLKLSIIREEAHTSTDAVFISAPFSIRCSTRSLFLLWIARSSGGKPAYSSRKSTLILHINFVQLGYYSEQLLLHRPLPDPAIQLFSCNQCRLQSYEKSLHSAKKKVKKIGEILI